MEEDSWLILNSPDNHCSGHNFKSDLQVLYIFFLL